MMSLDKTYEKEEEKRRQRVNVWAIGDVQTCTLQNEILMLLVISNCFCHVGSQTCDPHTEHIQENEGVGGDKKNKVYFEQMMI